MNINIKKKADLENVLGKKLADLFTKEVRKGFMKRLPYSVTFTKTKPSFHLDDGGILKAYAINLETSELLGEVSCGTGASVINNASLQLSEGYKAPKGHALCFVETTYNGRNHSWFLTIVTDDYTEQLG